MLLQMLWILPNTLGTILYSYASAASFESIRQKAMQLIRLSLYSTLIIAIGFLVFSYFFIPILFGAQFAQSVNVIFILVFGYTVFSIPSTCSALFSAYGHFRINFLVSFTVAFVSVFLYYFFTKYGGLYGAAIASNISYLLSTLFCIYVLKKYFQIRFVEFFQLKNDWYEIKNVISKYIKI
jgi:O-antigen/teichoic acid export membrane protein